MRPPRGSQLLDFDVCRPYIVAMTKLLDEAVEAVRRLPSDDQDDIARAIMQLAGSDLQRARRNQSAAELPAGG